MDTPETLSCKVAETHLLFPFLLAGVTNIWAGASFQQTFSLGEFKFVLRHEAFMTGNAKIIVFWGVMPCSPVGGYQLFAVTCCLVLHGTWSCKFA
jgi:hypothetical protein